MKSVEAWLAFSLLLLLANCSAAQAPQPGQPEGKMPALLTAKPLKDDPKDDEMRKLLKARYNEALGEVKGHYTAFQMARAPLDSFAEAGQRLMQAGVELCDTPADKVALLSQFVELTKGAEKIAQARLSSGRGSASAIHRARYQRLDAEIQLLRAKREAIQVSPANPKKADEIPNPTHIIKTDINLKPGVKTWVAPLARKGDLFQYYYITATKKEETIRTLKIELSSDAVVLVAIVDDPVANDPVIHTKKTITCYLKAAREGSATLKITPVGEDGKNRPSVEYQLRVIPTKWEK